MSKVKSMYEIIKRQNGEAFAKAIRLFDGGIFEIENLPEIIRFAGRNPLPVLSFLAGLHHNIYEKRVIASTKTPYELLNEAGYESFYVDSLEKQNSIFPYFQKGEELCTFSDKNRYHNYHIIHCIKKGADKLNRADFVSPQREDEYGKSVISIQILKKAGFVKITNRYNHTVENPDNTFGSNPDNIILGLTNALEREFDIELNCLQNVPEGYVYQNGCLFKYHTERENYYIGDNFFVQNGLLHSFNKDYELVADCFVFNLKEQSVDLLVPSNEGSDWENKAIFSKEMEGKKLTVRKNKNKRYLYLDENPFLAVEDGAIVEIYLEKSETSVDENQFKNLKKLVLQNVESVGCEFIADNSSLEEFIAPKLKRASDFFVHNSNLKNVYLPLLEMVGNHSFSYNKRIEELSLENLEYVGEGCCCFNQNLKKLSLDKISVIEDSFCNHNFNLKTILMKNLEQVYSNSFNRNDNLERLSLKKLTEIGDESFSYMEALKFVNMPSLIFMGSDVFYSLPSLKIFKAQQLENIGGSNCLTFTGLKNLFLPSLMNIYGPFLKHNQGLENVYLPNIKTDNKELLKYRCWPITKVSQQIVNRHQRGFCRD